MRFRQELVLGLLSLQETHTSQAPGSDSDLGLDDVPAFPEGIAFRVEEGLDTAPLVAVKEVLPDDYADESR